MAARESGHKGMKRQTATVRRIQKDKPRTELDGAYVQGYVPIRYFWMAMTSFLFSLPFRPLTLQPLS
jgi:hypothetical protein